MCATATPTRFSDKAKYASEYHDTYAEFVKVHRKLYDREAYKQSAIDRPIATPGAGRIGGKGRGSILQVQLRVPYGAPRTRIRRSLHATYRNILRLVPNVLSYECQVC